MKLREQLAYNLFFLSLNTFFLFGFVIVLKIILAKFMSPADLGVFSTALNIAYFLSFLCLFGLPGALNKLIAEEKDFRKVKAYLSITFRFALITSITLAFIIALLSDLLSFYLKLPRTIVFLIALFIPATAIFNVFYAFNYGLQRMKRLFISNIFRYSLILASVVLLAFLYKITPTTVFAVYVLFFSLAILFVFEKPGREISKLKKRLFSFSLTNFISALVDNVISVAPFIVIPLLITQQATGIFSLAQSASRLIFIFSIILLQSTFPLFSRNYRNKARISRLFNFYLKYTLIFSLPLILSFIVFQDALVLLLSSYEYLDASNLITPLTIGFFFMILFRHTSSILFSLGKIRDVVNLKLISLVFIPVLIALTYYYGVFGASLSYLLVFSFIAIFSLYVLVKEEKIGVNFDKKQTLAFTLSLLIFLSLQLIIDFIEATLTYKLIFILFSFIVYFKSLIISRVISKNDVEFFSSFILRNLKLKLQNL